MCPYRLINMEIVSKFYSKKDPGIIKYLFLLDTGETIEGVFLPFKKGEICVSCQLGCPINCIFCETGKNGFTRNLSKGEIITQVKLIQADIQKRKKKSIHSITFMGMGEPLLNYKNIKNAILTLRKNLKIERIRLSTVGIIP